MVWRAQLRASGVEAAAAEGRWEAGGGGSGEHLQRSACFRRFRRMSRTVRGCSGVGWWWLFNRESLNVEMHDGAEALWLRPFPAEITCSGVASRGGSAHVNATSGLSTTSPQHSLQDITDILPRLGLIVTEQDFMIQSHLPRTDVDTASAHDTISGVWTRRRPRRRWRDQYKRSGEHASYYRSAETS